MSPVLRFPALLGLALAPAVLFAARPNVIVYLADDLGWGSVGPYGCDPALVATPAIDRLAATGITFDKASTTGSVCSPTRYAFLTGRYSWRTRMKHSVINMPDPLLIDPDTPTIGSWLQDLGYQTAHFGKWHLGYKDERYDNLLGDLTPGPNDVGFDYHFGVPNNMDDLHKIYVENRGIYGLRSDRIEPYGMSHYRQPYIGYDAPQRDEPEVMEDLTGRAVKWIENRDKDRPFFLYFASVAVHHPILPSARMAGTSRAGPYGDFIQDIDYSVGRLLEALEREGILEDTVFLFTSDNGGDIPGGNRTDSPQHQAIAAGVAINGEWRGDKHQIYEGGFLVPFIVSFPRVLEQGVRSEARVSTVDIFATVAEITGTRDLPYDVAPDSFSFANVLLDPRAESVRPCRVVRDVAGRQAIRFGKWKLIDEYVPRNDSTVDFELYDLEADPGETENVIERFPEVASEGEKLLQAVRRADSSRELAR